MNTYSKKGEARQLRFAVAASFDSLTKRVLPLSRYRQGGRVAPTVASMARLKGIRLANIRRTKFLGVRNRFKKGDTMREDRFTKEQSMEALTKIVGEVARGFIGNQWTLEPGNPDNSYHWAYLVGAGDARLAFSFDDTWNPKRIEIRGCYPNTKAGNFYFASYDELKQAHNDSITVAFTRSPGEIQREIARRLLPGYFVLLEEAKRRIKAADDYEAGKAALYRELLELSGTADRNHWDGRLHVWLGDVSMEITSPNQVRIEHWYPDAALARELVKLIRQVKAEKESVQSC